MNRELLARIAKSLAHPERIRIIELFAERRPLMAHEIAARSTWRSSPSLNTCKYSVVPGSFR